MSVGFLYDGKASYLEWFNIIKLRHNEYAEGKALYIIVDFYISKREKIGY
jgi:hypothetical protein